MAFDDLEWVAESSFRLGDRVWAQGREAVHALWGGRLDRAWWNICRSTLVGPREKRLSMPSGYMVKYSDGTSSPSLRCA